MSQSPMPVIRTFIAIELPETIQQQLVLISKQLQAVMPAGSVRWVAVQNIHITLKFLGEISTGQIDQLTQALSIEVTRHPIFQVSVEGLGAFPNVHRPRIIWVGIKAPPELYELQKGIDTETARLGYPSEEREFSPHLTLGRISHNASVDDVRKIGEGIVSIKVNKLGFLKADRVHLFKSDLQPRGPIYTNLFSIPLNETILHS
jgi:RNA 2',3'-cyclic 3'-phosphodiesterase